VAHPSRSPIAGGRSRPCQPKRPLMAFEGRMKESLDSSVQLQSALPQILFADLRSIAPTGRATFYLCFFSSVFQMFGTRKRPRREKYMGTSIHRFFRRCIASSFPTAATGAMSERSQRTSVQRCKRQCRISSAPILTLCSEFSAQRTGATRRSSRTSC
jgi:hypothetical protein